MYFVLHAFTLEKEYKQRFTFISCLSIEQAYHKDDYSGARIVSKACALRDTVC
jgi:hypothetical protein